MKAYRTIARLAAVATTALTLATGAANAATYISYLEYRDSNGPTVVGDPDVPGDEFGYVTLVDGADGNSVNLTVTLYDNSWLQKSGSNTLFAWSLETLTGTSVISDIVEDASGATVTSSGAYSHSPWGDFTHSLNSNKNGGAPANQVHNLSFKVSNTTGLTFAGLDPTVEDGRLIAPGTGNRFDSNADGWWFFAHYQSADEPFSQFQSINIAARDAFCVEGCPTLTTAVPEPSTWAMMLIGFGGVGMSIRSRRRRLATPVVAA